ncbi:Uncharacterised protein [Escherichia coli]|nr:Uncharacterised protein [Escherichia coli]
MGKGGGNPTASQNRSPAPVFVLQCPEDIC